ncbi:MAG: Two component transcriptional regulator, CheY family [Thermomicrobiales bacterium]|jgi:DNA-binding NarL/FixJ family response regulator|nr:Two component transcriptional regulator, CheY family [Thermomicrobiales bacterium]
MHPGTNAVLRVVDKDRDRKLRPSGEVNRDGERLRRGTHRSDNGPVTEAPRVVLVEDEEIALTAVRRILEQSGFSVRREARDAQSGVEAALDERPDILLIDLSIPGGGISVIREVARRLPDTAVVVLTASDDHADLLDAIRAGAEGYLLKNTDPARLGDALHGVLAGEAAIPPVLMAVLIKDLQTQGRRRHLVGRKGKVDLTSREWEVLALMCDGCSTKQMAARLGLSPVTVRRHSSEIVRKLGAQDRREAIAIVEERV